jgi:tRNA (guanine37-N1)-methyltransferase
VDFEVLTLFPQAVADFVRSGLVGRAIERGAVQIHCTNPRDFSEDRHRTVDDVPYGGGAGMVIKPTVVAAAIESIVEDRGPAHVVLLSPSGRPFTQAVAARLATLPRIALLCGRYEGIDDRIREHYVDEVLSLGDFVLNGGEVAALAIIEAVARLHEGFVGNPQSIRAESFQDGESGRLLEHPHYTRPVDFRGHPVPAVLLGGDHQAVERWRYRASLIRTWSLRPDLRPQPQPSEPLEVVLAIHPVPGESAARWLEIGRQFGASVVWLDPAGASKSAHREHGEIFRDLRELRRAIRRKSGASPWVVALDRENLPIGSNALSLRQADAGESPEFPVFARVWSAIFDYLQHACVSEPQGEVATSIGGKSEAAPAIRAERWPNLVVEIVSIDGQCAKSPTTPSLAKGRQPRAVLADVRLKYGSNFLEKDLANSGRITDPSHPLDPEASRFELALLSLNLLVSTLGVSLPR